MPFFLRRSKPTAWLACRIRKTFLCFVCKTRKVPAYVIGEKRTRGPTRVGFERLFHASKARWKSTWLCNRRKATRGPTQAQAKRAETISVLFKKFYLRYYTFLISGNSTGQVLQISEFFFRMIRILPEHIFHIRYLEFCPKIQMVYHFLFFHLFP